MPTLDTISHVTLTVTDLERSVEWYATALGLRRVRDMEGAGWRRVLMAGGDGLMIGLQAHEGTADGDRFDEKRVGLDHLSFACTDRSGVEAWLAGLDAAGVEHSAIAGDPAAVATCQDPDGIAIEFFAPRTN